MKSKTEIGEKGEKLAAEYLTRKGYKIIARNWHLGHKEIDIIAYDQNTLVIVEVKMRKSNYYGHPSEFVSRQKQRNLVEAADAYLSRISAMPPVRFDVVAILGNAESFRLEHIEDAFTPELY